jgi:hypothetical protein
LASGGRQPGKLATDGIGHFPRFRLGGETSRLPPAPAGRSRRDPPPPGCRCRTGWPDRGGGQLRERQIERAGDAPDFLFADPGFDEGMHDPRFRRRPEIGPVFVQIVAIRPAEERALRRRLGNRRADGVDHDRLVRGPAMRERRQQQAVDAAAARDPTTGRTAIDDGPQAGDGFLPMGDHVFTQPVALT